MPNDTVTMNEATDYVHTHVVNYEPTYLVLANCVLAWQENVGNPLAIYRDILQSEVEKNMESMGLREQEVLAEYGNDVDYAVMIQWESENS